MENRNQIVVNQDMVTPIKLKDLRKGDFFTFKPVGYPKESQVYIKDDYDRSQKKYFCQKFTDFCDGKYKSGETVVFTGFTF